MLIKTIKDLYLCQQNKLLQTPNFESCNMLLLTKRNSRSKKLFLEIGKAEVERQLKEHVIKLKVERVRNRSIDY